MNTDIDIIHIKIDKLINKYKTRSKELRYMATKYQDDMILLNYIDSLILDLEELKGGK